MRRTSPTRAIRRDADRNRRRLLAEAAVAFAQFGLSASLADIARRADVGIGTLYRHFPSRDDLIAGVAEDELDRLLAAAEGALAADDPWHGLLDLCTVVVARGRQNRVVRDLVILHDAETSEFYAALDKVARRARSQLRPEATTADLVLVLAGLARIAEVTADQDPHQWRRQLALALDGLRAERPAESPHHPALSPVVLSDALGTAADRALAANGRRAGRSAD